MIGLPEERTALSWSRTSLSLVAVCALLARDPLGPWGGALLTGAALVLAAGSAVAGRRRRSALSSGLGAGAGNACREVHALGLAVGALSVAVGAAVVLGGQG